MRKSKNRKDIIAWPGSPSFKINSSINRTWKIVGIGATTLATVGSIVSVFGLEGFVVLATVGLFGAVFQIYRMSQKLKYIEEALFAELPHHHRFLVEFLKSTYISRGKDVITVKNAGANIHTYQNNFCVKGSDCSNSQIIDGRNVSHVPLRGISFALVGGSSMSTNSLGSRFKINGTNESTPEFLIDDDRFKVAFCSFPSPLKQNKKFLLEYSDSWKGAMRKEGDGFFFPEALYFPDGIGELLVKLEFDFEIESLAALEINTDNFSVVTCDTQPEAVSPIAGMVNSFFWSKLAPSTNSIFILYYRAKLNH
jgi:hypothetical protein